MELFKDEHGNEQATNYSRDNIERLAKSRENTSEASESMRLLVEGNLSYDETSGDAIF